MASCDRWKASGAICSFPFGRNEFLRRSLLPRNKNFITIWPIKISAVKCPFTWILPLSLNFRGDIARTNGNFQPSFVRQCTRTRKIRIWSRYYRWDLAVNLFRSVHASRGREGIPKDVENTIVHCRKSDGEFLAVLRRACTPRWKKKKGNRRGFARWFCYYFSLADGIDKRRVTWWTCFNRERKRGGESFVPAD